MSISIIPKDILRKSDKVSEKSSKKEKNNDYSKGNGKDKRSNDISNIKDANKNANGNDTGRKCSNGNKCKDRNKNKNITESNNVSENKNVNEYKINDDTGTNKVYREIIGRHEKKDKINKRNLEESFYEVDMIKRVETERQLKHNIEKEIGNMNLNAEFMNGKVYENGELIYEGEFIQAAGMKSYKWYAHGYGKAYYDNGQIEYEGNFMYGHPQGYGKYYYWNGVLRWKGVFQAAVGEAKLDLWQSSLGYVDKYGRIRYGESYDTEGNLIYYGEFNKEGEPIKWE